MYLDKSLNMSSIFSIFTKWMNNIQLYNISIYVINVTFDEISLRNSEYQTIIYYEENRV